MLLSCTQVFAHAIWLEREGEKNYLYFGEFSHAKKEKSGKLLDKITPNGDYKRLEDRIELINREKKGDLTAIVEMPARKMKDSQELVQTIFYTRNGRTSTQSLLPLDLVAKKPQSNYFTLLFENKALAKAEVIVTAPSKWEKRFRTNKKGELSIQTPYKGLYMIEVVHKQDQKRYVYTLTFFVEKGLSWAYDPECQEKR